MLRRQLRLILRSNAQDAEISGFLNDFNRITDTMISVIGLIVKYHCIIVIIIELEQAAASITIEQMTPSWN